MRTIPNKELRFLNGAHGAHYIISTTPRNDVIYL